MNAESTLEPVRRSIEVTCGPADAFRLFTDEIDSWWPLATHSVGEADAVSCHFEGRDGGKISETYADGTTHLWGTISARSNRRPKRSQHEQQCCWGRLSLSHPKDNLPTDP